MKREREKKNKIHTIKVECRCSSEEISEIDKLLSEIQNHIRYLLENVKDTNNKIHKLEQELKHLGSEKSLMGNFRSWLVSKGYIKEFDQ